jgi:hypothetical protein
VREIVRGIEVDRDPAGAPAKSAAMPVDDGFAECNAQTEQVLPIRSVLETRQRRLRGQCVPGHRITTHDQLVDWISGEPACIVGVGVAARQREYALREKLGDLVRDLRWLPRIANANGETIDETDPSIRRLQQDRAAIRAGVFLIEASRQRAIEQLGKKKTGCRGRLGHAKASCVVGVGVNNRFLPRGGFCLFNDRE